MAPVCEEVLTVFTMTSQGLSVFPRVLKVFSGKLLDFSLCSVGDARKT